MGVVSNYGADTITLIITCSSNFVKGQLSFRMFSYSRT